MIGHLPPQQPFTFSGRYERPDQRLESRQSRLFDQPWRLRWDSAPGFSQHVASIVSPELKSRYLVHEGNRHSHRESIINVDMAFAQQWTCHQVALKVNQLTGVVERYFLLNNSRQFVDLRRQFMLNCFQALISVTTPTIITNTQLDSVN